ncbi:hypothetical protein [Moorena sp. SIO3H5]|uniref:hypothetical protein n=1 Tax=Moorena sp. SIO3H5 TaxID=2607834 RepID=UPI0013B750CC|nr:hypothetical protein [Moorena sp. SIO3H5]NEO72394.1 hypothetical protein [Moorena sp. SIO3H5]
MKKIGSTTLLIFATLSGLLLFPSEVKADRIRYCYRVPRYYVEKDAANHREAYDDGYKEGRRDARRGIAYEERSAGGEFSRGYRHGYYGRRYRGQRRQVADRRNYYNTRECRTYNYDDKENMKDVLGRILQQFERDLRSDMNWDNNRQRFEERRYEDQRFEERSRDRNFQIDRYPR